jgi:hypothetical protein
MKQVKNGGWKENYTVWLGVVVVMCYDSGYLAVVGFYGNTNRILIIFDTPR